MTPYLDVLVIGGCAIDHTIRAAMLPTADRSVNGDLFLRDCGGKGLNQAVAAARLGARTALIACVGADSEGDEVPEHGFDKQRYHVSMDVGERVLLPAVREAPADTMVIADGFSCREQIRQATGRRAHHFAEMLGLIDPADIQPPS